MAFPDRAVTWPLAAVTQTGSTVLTVIGWIGLGVGFASAAAICWDIFVRGHRQHMAVMNVVYPLTALYFGPVAAWFYFRRGVRMSRNGRASTGST